MKKIRLDVDALQVTSFAAEAEAPDADGTVEGNQIGTLRCPTHAYATSPCDTCYQGSCADSCGIPKTGQACYPC
jgi:hypothetical protein